MDNILRTFILAGLGALEGGEDRARALLEELEERGERAVQDARALADLSAKRAAERRLGRARELRAAIAEELARQNVASQEGVAALTERVSALERTVADLKSRAVP